MKLKIISVLIVILLLIMNVPVYAETTLPAPPSDAYEYWAYMIDEHDMIHFITSENPLTVYDEDGTDIKIFVGRTYKYVDNKWQLNDIIDNGRTWEQNWVMVAANHDIAYEDGSGFFFLRPKVTPLIKTMKETDFGTILKNFSVGLTPLLGLVILGISLEKGWGFLRNQLTR